MAIQEAQRIASEILRLARIASSEGEFAEYVENLCRKPPEVMALLPEAIEAAAKGKLEWLVARYAHAAGASGLAFTFEKQLIEKVHPDGFARHYWDQSRRQSPQATELILSLLDGQRQIPVIQALWRRTPFHEMAGICQGLVAKLANDYFTADPTEDDVVSVSEHYRDRLLALREAGVSLDALCSNLHLAITTIENAEVAILLSELWAMASHSERTSIIRSINDLIMNPYRLNEDDRDVASTVEWLTEIRDLRLAMLEASVPERVGITMAAP